MRALGSKTMANYESPAARADLLVPAAGKSRLALGTPGDVYEREADRVSERVARMAMPGTSGTLRLTGRDAVGSGKWSALRQPEETKLNGVGNGRPLTSQQKAYFEPRFGMDFGSVRIHTGRSADTAARAVDAFAYTRGSDIVFREGQYRPNTSAGRLILAHELCHVVQQGAAAPRRRAQGVDGNELRPVPIGESYTATAVQLVQRIMCEPPQPHMPPPGDCSWAEYVILRGSVETAKAVVSTLGACSPGDSCLFLATKIAAITSEVAARVAVMATCFKGGDSGHCEQLQNKINMMNRCYRHFDASDCSPELITAMAVVVAKAREVIAAVTIAAAIAAVVLLIIALIALWKVIVALAAAAAEVLAIKEAAFALVALLTLLLSTLTPSS